jgi:outer membrane protein assembly factor BamA
VGPDYGLLATAGLRRTHYGFRKRPYAYDWTLFVGLTTGYGWGDASFDADFRLENSGLHIGLEAGVSGIELLNFHGLGNDTQWSDILGQFKVPYTQFFMQPTLEYEIKEHLELRAGAWIKGSRTDDDDSAFFSTVADTLYGAGNFGQAGVSGRIRWDSRDNQRSATRGFYLKVEGSAAPAVWDLDGSYATLAAEARTYLTWNAEPFRPTLALRAGGQTSSGKLPFQEAAYVGGRSILRGWASDRFAGDASAYGGVELRTRLSGFTLMVPGDFGVFGLIDAARVSLDGDSPDGWHMGYGGGLWFSFVDPNQTLTLTLASGEERKVFSLGLGFAY